MQTDKSPRPAGGAYKEQKISPAIVTVTPASAVAPGLARCNTPKMAAEARNAGSGPKVRQSSSRSSNARIHSSSVTAACNVRAMPAQERLLRYTRHFRDSSRDQRGWIITFTAVSSRCWASKACWVSSSEK